ncbi:MAG: hypothetical protein K0V04_41375 [Deltaproteobacteria bacterium]|nr:hypothetical protein [Deltaproteobacteria bacterium]
MSSLRPLALCVLLSLVACGKDAPGGASPGSAKAKPAKAAVVPAKKAAPNPHAAVVARESDQPLPPLVASAPGKFDLTIDGVLSHYERLPPGQNRSIALTDRDIARVTIAAAETETGTPHMRLTLENLRPDQLQYPVTLSGETKPDGDHPKTVSARYQVNDNRVYVNKPGDGPPFSVTLLGYEDAKLSGTFEGTVEATKAGAGAPLSISGVFEVKLGLRNVAPNVGADTRPSAPGKAPEAKAPGGEAQPPL